MTNASRPIEPSPEPATPSLARLPTALERSAWEVALAALAFSAVRRPDNLKAVVFAQLIARGLQSQFARSLDTNPGEVELQRLIVPARTTVESLQSENSPIDPAVPAACDWAALLPLIPELTGLVFLVTSVSSDQLAAFAAFNAKSPPASPKPSAAQLQLLSDEVGDLFDRVQRTGALDLRDPHLVKPISSFTLLALEVVKRSQARSNNPDYFLGRLINISAPYVLASRHLARLTWLQQVGRRRTPDPLPGREDLDKALQRAAWDAQFWESTHWSLTYDADALDNFEDDGTPFDPKNSPPEPFTPTMRSPHLPPQDLSDDAYFARSPWRLFWFTPDGHPRADAHYPTGSFAELHAQLQVYEKSNAASKEKSLDAADVGTEVRAAFRVSRVLSRAGVTAAALIDHIDRMDFYRELGCNDIEAFCQRCFGIGSEASVRRYRRAGRILRERFSAEYFSTIQEATRDDWSPEPSAAPSFRGSLSVLARVEQALRRLKQEDHTAFLIRVAQGVVTDREINELVKNDRDEDELRLEPGSKATLGPTVSSDTVSTDGSHTRGLSTTAADSVRDASPDSSSSVREPRAMESPAQEETRQSSRLPAERTESLAAPHPTVSATGDSAEATSGLSAPVKRVCPACGTVLG